MQHLLGDTPRHSRPTDAFSFSFRLRRARRSDAKWALLTRGGAVGPRDFVDRIPRVEMAKAWRGPTTIWAIRCRTGDWIRRPTVLRGSADLAEGGGRRRRHSPGEVVDRRCSGTASMKQDRLLFREEASALLESPGPSAARDSPCGAAQAPPAQARTSGPSEWAGVEGHPHRAWTEHSGATPCQRLDIAVDRHWRVVDHAQRNLAAG